MDYYQKILESHTNLVVFSLDQEYRYTAFNQNHVNIMHQIWGIDIAIGHCMLDYILDEKDKAKAKANFDKALSGKSFTRIEEYGKESLKRSFYEDQYNPIKNDEQKVIGVSVFVTDITKRKTDELDLVEREKGFRELAEMLPMNIFETDVNFSITYANHLILETFQYTKGEFQNSFNALKLVLKEEQDNLRKELERCGADKNTVIIEHRAVKKDHTIIPSIFHISAIYNKGELSGYRGAIADITKQKEAEKTLNHNQEMLKLAAETARIGYFDWNLEKQQNIWDDGMHKIFGLDPNSKIDRVEYYMSVVHPSDIERITKEFSHSLSPENTLSYEKQEYRISLGYNQVRHLESHIQYIRNKKGTITSMIGAVIDITDRKLIEQELRQSKRILNDVINNIPARVFWKDRHGVFLGCNNHFAADIGQNSASAIIGKSDFELTDQKTADAYHKEDLRVMKTRQPLLNFETTDTDLNGDEKWFNVSKLPLQDDVGNVYGIIGTYEMIHERKKMELALLESEEKYRAIFEGSEEGILVFDMESERFLFANPAICRLLGWEFEEMKSLGISDIHPPDELEKIKAGIARIIKGTKRKTEEVQFLKKNGQSFPGTMSAGIVNWGERKCLVGFITDITEQKKVRHRLQFQSDLQSILMKIASDFINIPLAQMDVQMNESLKEMGEFVAADRAYVFTYDFENQTCTNTHEWCAPDTEPMIEESQNLALKPVIDLVKPHLAGESIFVPDSSLLKSKRSKELLQSQGILSMLTVPLMHNDDCVGFVGFDSVTAIRHYNQDEIDILRLFADVLVNINMRVESQQELEQLLDTTVDQNDRLKEFSFMTSHNIRSSVANLLGLTNMIEAQPNDPSYLDMLKTTTTKLKVTVDNINELINFENQMGVFEKVKCNVSESISRVLQLTNHIVKENNIEIKLSVCADHYFLAYPAYIDSIAHNLLTNAIKYGITEQSKVIEIHSSETEDSTTLHFKDYGLGMNLKLHGQKLFKLGTRLHDSKEGQGLGLFMTNRQIESMGGSISVESEINKGSLFKVTLPK